jgi:hypothetical protein
MNILSSYKTKHIALWLTLFLTLALSGKLLAADVIKNAGLEKSEIGTNEKPVITLELDIAKTRDLFIVIRNMKSWQSVKQSMYRIKKSGQYHLAVEVEDLTPGRYRVDSYLAPKGKNWAERLAEPIFNEFTVLDVNTVNQTKVAPIKKVAAEYAKNDQIVKLTWPKWIDKNGDIFLKIRFDITQPRDLHIKLLGSDNQQELGAIKLPVNTIDDVSVPFSDMLTNFDQGKYMWVAYLTAKQSELAITQKVAKYFNVIQPKLATAN